MVLHFGHLPFLPTCTSGTLIFWPQFLQLNLITKKPSSSLKGGLLAPIYTWEFCHNCTYAKTIKFVDYFNQQIIIKQGHKLLK